MWTNSRCFAAQIAPSWPANEVKHLGSALVFLVDILSRPSNILTKSFLNIVHIRGGEWSLSLATFYWNFACLSVSFFQPLCASRSLVFSQDGVSEPRFFARSRSPDSFVRFFKMTSSRLLIFNFIEATFNFREKVNPNFS